MPDVALEKVNVVIDSVVHETWGQILSALVSRVRDIQLAEDCLQEAILAAWKTWPSKGIPDQPKSWLYRIGLRKAIDQIRRRENFEAKRGQLEYLQSLEQSVESNKLDTEIPDDRLRLIFTCCHPALEPKSSVALTLRAVGGLQTREVARAFLVEEATMAQRLTRAKRKIRDAGIAYEVPQPETWPERIESVLSVLYFIFNEGYQATSGDKLLRRDLCEEAIHLARVFSRLVPNETEAAGLLALMLSHHARHAARANAQNEFVPLEHHDRNKWNKTEIAEADQILTDALEKGSPGPLQIQAAISILHSRAINWSSTDWIQIELLYHELFKHQPTAVVRLNQLVAYSMHAGVESAWPQIEELDQELKTYQPFQATKADLLRRLGRLNEAIDSYNRAINLTTNQSEKHFLSKRRSLIEAES